MKTMVSKEDSHRRIESFKTLMDRENPDWKMALITGKVNQYYFTGTMQDGILILTRDSEPVFWVRRSVERARDESPLEKIEPMGSYRTAAAHYGNKPECIYLERELIPLALYDRLARAFGFTESKSLDRQLLKIRSVKDDGELDLIRESGVRHVKLLDKRLPTLLKEGMNELEFASCLYSEMLDLGYHGISRFSMFQTEMFLGQIGFGENSCYPSYFNGPGGSRGMHAAVPLLGDPNTSLARGDMVFADIGFGYDGYHTDHTMTYLYKGELPQRARAYHDYCIVLRDETAARLKPGEVPSQIYAEIMEKAEKESPEGFMECFMGHKGNQVKFLGHGVGLHVDEFPVIAKGFDEPLEEKMVLALEPKCSVTGVGTVGVEDTYAVTPAGGVCLTGGSPGMIRID